MTEFQLLQQLQEDLQNTITALVLSGFVAGMWLIGLTARMVTIAADAKKVQDELQQHAEYADELIGKLTGRVYALEQQHGMDAPTGDVLEQAEATLAASAELGERAIIEIRRIRERADAFKKQYGTFSADEEAIHTQAVERQISQVRQRYERELAMMEA